MLPVDREPPAVDTWREPQKRDGERQLRREHGIERSERLRRQRHVERLHVVREVIDGLSADDGRRHAGWRTQSPVTLPSFSRVYFPLSRPLARGDHGTTPSPSSRAMGTSSPSTVLRERVFDLERDERREPADVGERLRLRDLPGWSVRDVEVADLARPHEVVHRGDRLCDGRVLVPDVQVVEIVVVVRNRRSECSQAAVMAFRFERPPLGSPDGGCRRSWWR